ncbi:MAG: Serine/threonine-protein kinase PknB, partial [Planctomycetota bacterium]
MPIDIHFFVSELNRLEIFPSQKFTPFTDKLSSYQNGESLAKDLIKAGLLTKYQAEQILMGKGNGLRMGKYLIEAKLGAGGMGQVFKAQHAGMGRTVAIKVIHTKNKLDSQTIQRFDREVKAAARLIHPNVITVFDADHENSQHYMVMEYCEGKDLFAVVRTQGTCGIYDAIEYIMQAALGLQYAHEQGVIHRDIKPGNILLDKNKKIKIVDMGLARLQALSEEEKAPMLTATTAIMGTVDFMSPEQGLSTRNADARADIYSLGASLYYLLTGKVMYDGETAFAKLIA